MSRETATDSLRGLRQELTVAVQRARSAVKTGKPTDALFADYLELVRLTETRRQECLAFGLGGKLVEPMEALPISPGVVGRSAAEKFAREWHVEPSSAPAVKQRIAA